MIHYLVSAGSQGHPMAPPVRALLAGLTAWAVCLVVGRPLLGRLRRLNVREKTEKTPIEDEQLRRSIAGKSGTPTMGGLILLAGMLAGVLAWADPANLLVAGVLGCTLAMAALGVVDDTAKLRGRTHTDRGLKVRHKLLIQGCVGALLGLLFLRAGGASPRVFSTGGAAMAFALALGWPALIVATMANATNVTDGLDGLLAGLAPLAGIVLGGACWAVGTPDVAARLGMGHVSGAGELCVFCGALTGACVGFLHYNRHPARVFMGDTGSMAIGGALAATALAAGQELVLGLAGLVFLIEFGSSLLQIGSFQLLGRRLLPIAPMHHIFQQRGVPEPRIVMGFYLAGVAAAVVGIGSMGL
ncbi:MAG: phospho-N-acetylmuramoyl-pentapeptide-transferase [Candidatus Brocadiaceae bacterium]|jgi:phospho-N-acetylmuramoyl-pentapeptide-transferase